MFHIWLYPYVARKTSAFMRHPKGVGQRLQMKIKEGGVVLGQGSPPSFLSDVPVVVVVQLGLDRVTQLRLEGCVLAVL